MTEDNYQIDVYRLRKLMSEYESARTVTDKRDIENEVLKATVWQIPDAPVDDREMLPITSSQLEYIGQYVPEDDLRGQRFLRAPHMEKMWDRERRNR